MGNETAYEPLKGSEADTEAGPSNTPRWAKAFGDGESRHRLQPYLPVLRIAVEIVLVCAVFLLSFKVFLARETGPCRIPMGPNDPLKNC